MAIYKIFPNADATIYSYFPAKNTGLDEILEVSVTNTDNAANYFAGPIPNTPILTDDIRRSLILFSDSDIQILNGLKSGSWDAYLRLYLSNAENLSIPYTLNANQVTDYWTMGTGKFPDSPETRNGVSWYNTASYVNSQSNWSSPSYYITPGGGTWNSTICSQSFQYKDVKDVNMSVKPILANWFNGNNNYGIIVKHSSSIENNPNSYIKLSFFSTDTHTIYPPCLELRWDDSSYSTGSLTKVTSNQTIINVTNNPYTIKSSTNKFTFRVTARDQFPVRQFTTSSIYTTVKCLPSTSYWSLQDVKTEDVIVDFDNNYTKISCDSTSNFFNLYMSGLEPERYYKILIKTVLDSGETIVYNSDNVFKIVR